MNVERCEEALAEPFSDAQSRDAASCLEDNPSRPCLRRRLKGFLAYFCKAVALVFFLTYVGMNAAGFSTLGVLLAVLLYALVATMGVMYGVVVKRFHNQSLYAEEGVLYRRNGKWPLLMAGVFALSSFSALVFILDAPSWNDAQWLCIWIVAFAYGPAFSLVGRFARKLYSPTYFKSRSLIWSSLVVALFLCVCYAFVAIGPFADAATSGLQEAIANRSMPFEDSSCALLVEADKLNSYSDTLVRYGLGYMAGSSYAAAFAINIVLSASVFLCIANQIGLCVLSRKELGSVFRALPVNAEGGSVHRVKPCYFFALLVAALIVTSLFLAANYAAELDDENDPGWVDQMLDEATDWFGVLPDIPDVIAAKGLMDRYEQGVTELRENYGEDLRTQIADYYDCCEGNIEDYLQWCESPLGRAAGLLRFAGEGAAKSEFVERVVDPVEDTELIEAYEEYEQGLARCYDELWAGLRELNPSMPHVSSEVQNAFSSSLQLWPLWDKTEGALVVKALLPSFGGEYDRESAKSEIAEFVKEREELALRSLNELETKYMALLVAEESSSGLVSESS